MRMKRFAEFILVSLLLIGGCYTNMVQGDNMNPPGVVIHNIPTASHEYVGSPSIVIMPNGTYVASHDCFGNRLSDTYVYTSKDCGKTWEQVAELKLLTWATLFNRGEELYLIGVKPKETIGYGDFVVRKSLDYGCTWTEPKDEKSGLIRRGFYHCAPVPIVCHKGKYWRALENMGQAWGWGPFSALMTSIPCEADLLDAEQWIFSNEIKYNSTWKKGTTAWLEGNAVVNPQGDIKNILRVASSQEDVAAMVSVSADGETITFDPQTDFIKLPGAAKKFTIRYDEKSGRYWTLSNFVLQKDRSKTDNGGIRNTQVLMYSNDLKEWNIKDTVLTCENAELYGFQYVDWQFDGDDIVFVSRTAWRDKTGNPPRQHDANYLTFHRIHDFRILGKKQVIHSSNEHNVPDKLEPFCLNQIRLLSSPFKHAQQLDAEWLLSLDPNRLLHRFHKNAGLLPKGDNYGGWEEHRGGGRGLGHYMSACAMMWAATGRTEFKRRTDYVVDELEKCQKAKGTGYIGSVEDSIWIQVGQGDIRSTGFDLNGGIVPWFILHKLFAGLYDTYMYTGNEKAKTVLVNLCDWAYKQFKNLNEEQWQKVLACEHGGMLEALVNVYSITGDKKYLQMSHWFDHKQFFSPLAHQVDSLAGLHANTQIPKVVGLERRHQLTHCEEDKIKSHFFWETVVKNHTYCIGGNGDGEHFGPKGILSNRLSDRTAEACNTYNMLKLTKMLLIETSDVKYGDYYEKALYNHILASQNPETGMTTYYTPLVAGGKKVYSTAFETFTCCVGTGFENHARYGEAIYFKGKNNNLLVNLYIPSVLMWEETGMTITQKGSYEKNGKVRFTIDLSNPKTASLFFRIPYWTTMKTKVTVNDKKIGTTVTPGMYFEITKEWEKGDKIEIHFDMPVYTEPTPDNPNRLAIKYGPFVLAGKLGNGIIDPLKDIPVLIVDDKPVSEWLNRISRDSVLFRTRNIGELSDVTLAPFYTLYNERYIVYFDVFTTNGWRKRKQEYQDILREQEYLKERTIDFIQLGEMEPEREHHLVGSNTAVGEFIGRKFRLSWNDGWFAFDMKVIDSEPLQMISTYCGNDGEQCSFDIYIDDNFLKTIILKPQASEKLYDIKLDIPLKYISSKKKINIAFKAHKGKMVGRVFGCRIIRK